MPSGQDTNRDYDAKLGFGSYMVKKLYEMAVIVGSQVAGVWGGLALGNKWFPDNPMMAEKGWKDLIGRLSTWPGLKQAPSLQAMWVAIGGAAFGGLIGGLTLGYGHWKKEKQAQLQVDEITKDISDIELFKKTDPELKRENQRLWAMLKEKEVAPKIRSKPAGSWREKIAASETPENRIIH